SLIYEERAMQARFDYLIRIAKERNIKCRIGIRK
ncbi:MAG: YaaL family protein, partial [Oscillospiraceae bacterium]|nr:YaaL family protein [Oscillospiraceae bacterium]